jgi:hypothetical protein
MAKLTGYQLYARKSDAQQDAQDRANRNGAPVAVVYNPVTRMHYVIENPDELEKWHPSHIVSMHEPKKEEKIHG